MVSRGKGLIGGALKELFQRFLAMFFSDVFKKL
jgi:hypothetical protein